MIQKRLSYYWMFLSFQSGVINSAGFVLFSVYLTHMTGLFSKIGLEAEQTHLKALLWWLSIPLVFLIGALLSTVWIEGQARHRRNPRYEWVFLLMGTLLALMGFANVLADLGVRAMWVIAFCSGMQNAIFNERTGAIMRSTHFTGTTTDLGISLARVFFKTTGKDPKQIAFESRLASLRAGSIASFIGGSMLGSLLALKFGTTAFWMPALICFVLAYDATKVLKVLEARR